MKKSLLFFLILTSLFFSRCDVLQEIQLPVSGALTNDEIVRGLKEALEVGTNKAIEMLAKENGFYLDDEVKIPFPEKVKYVEDKLRALGMNSLVENFVQQMNHAAEKAVSKAKPIFYQAILNMTFTDALDILHGSGHAATDYFRGKTYQQLVAAYKPDIRQVLNTTHLVDYWEKVITTYNKIPFTQKVETDLPQYVAEKTIDGLFIKLAEQEKLIRDDPKARVTDILKKVFAQSGR